MILNDAGSITRWIVGISVVTTAYAVIMTTYLYDPISLGQLGVEVGYFAYTLFLIAAINAFNRLISFPSDGLIHFVVVYLSCVAFAPILYYISASTSMSADARWLYPALLCIFAWFMSFD